MTLESPPPPERDGVGGLLLICLAVLAPLLFASWQIVDHDALLRLAAGRTIFALGGPPLTDPLTFSMPQAIWCNPEWLGDLLWWQTYQIGGFQGVVALKHALLVLSMILVATLARRLGARAPFIAIILLAGLFAASGRLTVRNYLHAYWLLPLYGHVLLSSKGRPWLLFATLPLGLLWANLHSSFILGWVALGAHLVEQLYQRDRRTAALAGVAVALHPLLPLMGPFGFHAYDQLVDHTLGSAVYGTMILEWQRVDQARAVLAQLPFHLLALVGLLSFLPRQNRRNPGGALLLAAALALGYRAQRFAPLLLFVAGPVIALNLTRVLSAQLRARQATVMAAMVLLVVTPIMAAKGARPALDSLPGPTKVAKFAANMAPKDARLFNPFNAGAQLLFHAAPPLTLYIDPRNNLGHDHLRRYVKEVLPHPERFEQEVSRLHIDLALCNVRVPRFATLARHLAASSAWSLLYFDGRYALYVHDKAREGHRYQPHVLEAVLATTRLEYLRGADDTALARDLNRLEQMPALQALVRGYLALEAAGTDPRAHERAAKLLQRGMRSLPPSPHPLAYLARAWRGAGKQREAEDLISSGLSMFPKNKLLQRLAKGR